MLFSYYLIILNSNLQVNMKSRLIKKISFIFVLLALSLSAQGYRITIEQAEEAERILLNIKNGLLEGQVSKFTEDLDSKTYLNLSNGIAGYFSSNQASNVLLDFIKENIPYEFEFYSMKTRTFYPFGSASLKYTNNGIRKSSKVFISPKPSGSAWKISQITIN